MIKTLTCRQCGKEFDSDKRRRFCDDCNIARHRERNRLNMRRYYAEHHDQILDYKRRYHIANRDRILDYKHRRRPRIYILLKLKRIDDGKDVKPFCHTCGKWFKPRYKGERYCSDKCRQQSPLYRVWLRIQSRCGY